MVTALEDQAEGPNERAEASHDEQVVSEGPFLTPVFALGADVTVQTPIHYLDGCHVAYAVGRHVAILHHEQQQMQFLPDMRGGRITCLALAYNRKYLAVVERGGLEGRDQISIYGNQGKWKRVRGIPLGAEAGPSKKVSRLSFSSDNKYLVTVGTEPEWTLLYWRWASGKIVGSYQIGDSKDDAIVTRLSCNPWEHSTVAASGPKELRIVKLPKEDASVRVSQPTCARKGDVARFRGEITDHVWLEPESLAFSTDVGSVVIVSRDEVVATVETPNPCAITALTRFGRGFLTADRRGQCALFERAVSEGGKTSYVAATSFHALRDGQCIRSLRMNPLEERAACALESGGLALLTVAGPTVMDWGFSRISRGFHQGPAYGIDVAVQRPLIATFGIDQTVRMWNFLDRQCVLVKQLDEDVFCLALHPSGLYLALGFRDKLRLFHVLADDVMLVREFHFPGCKQIAFSHSGHLFVASNSSQSQVFNTYTSATLGMLRGHTAAVRSASWAGHDQRLVTVGLDGAAYEWKMDSCLRDQSTENVMKSVQYSYVAYGQPGGTPFYVTAGRDKIFRLRHMINGACEHEVKIDGCQITALALVDHNRLLLAATDEGTVRVYPWFGNKLPGECSGEKPGRFEEFQLHQGAITGMCVSPDHSFLFTTGEDGSVFTCEIRTETERSGLVRTGTSGERWSYGPDACLVNREDYREIATSVDELKAHIEALERRGEYQTMVQETQRKEQVAAANQATEAVRHAADKTVEDLKEMMERLKVDHATQLRLLKDAHLSASAHVDALHTAQLEKASAKLACAHEEFEDERSAAARALDAARARAQQEVQNLREEVDAEKARARARVEDARRQADEARREAEERRKQLDEEFEMVANRGDLRREEQRIDAERKESELRARMAIFRKDLDASLLAKQIAQDELTKREGELTAARAQLQESGAKHHSLLAILADRETTLQNLETSIQRIRAANQDLEVHKYLTDHKLKDMQQSIAPREDELARLRGELEARDGELQKSVLEQGNQRVALKDQADKLAGCKRDAAALHATIKTRESAIAQFEHTLSLAMTETDPEEKQRRLQHLYKRHCGQKSADSDADVSPEALVELQRQRTYLEHSSRHQQKNAADAERNYGRASKRAREENQVLLAENMDLRQDKKALLQQLHRLEEKIKLHPQLLTSRGPTNRNPSLTPRVNSPRVPRFSPAALAAANAVRDGLGSGYRDGLSSVRDGLGSASSTTRSGRLVKGSVSRSLAFSNGLDELENGSDAGLSARLSGGSSRPGTARETVIEAQRNEIARLKALLQHRGSLSGSDIPEDESELVEPTFNPVVKPLTALGLGDKTGAQTARPWTASEKLDGGRNFRAVGLQPELLIPLIDAKVDGLTQQSKPRAQTARPLTSRLPVQSSNKDGTNSRAAEEVRVSRKVAVGGGFSIERQRSANGQKIDTAVKLVRRKSMPAG